MRANKLIFLKDHCYPEGCGKVDKRVLRRMASSCLVENGLLFHRKPKFDIDDMLKFYLYTSGKDKPYK